MVRVLRCETFPINERLIVNRRLCLTVSCICFAMLLSISGCAPQQPQIPPPEAPVVPISQALEQSVTDFVDLTGRTDAVESVDIRPRVTGYLVEMPFREGAEVKADDLLFVVDPRPYQAQLDQAKGLVKLYHAQLGRWRSQRTPATWRSPKTPGAVSLQQLDQDRAAVGEAEAQVGAYEASLEVYQLNLDFTKVVSPIDGQVSRYYLTRGNLVVQDQTLLTTVVSLDPMYAYFDFDETTLLRIRRADQRGTHRRVAARHRAGADGFARRRAAIRTKGRSTS